MSSHVTSCFNSHTYILLYRISQLYVLLAAQQAQVKSPQAILPCHQPRILEERKLEEWGKNTSISSLPNEIMPLLVKANEMYDEMAIEHQRH